MRIRVERTEMKDYTRGCGWKEIKVVRDWKDVCIYV